MSDGLKADALGRGHRVRREDAVAEARRESLDLPR